MTAVKSRYLKIGKGRRKHEEQNSEGDTSDENVLDDESDVEDSDEELKDMKIELEKLKSEKKKRKLAEKKKKLQKQIEAEKKGLQKLFTFFVFCFIITTFNIF
jgi:predicted nuclease with TOPRIM domain